MILKAAVTMSAIPNEIHKPTQLPVWQGGVLRCTRRIEETHDSATFVLSADHPVIFNYLPGQFITIGVEINGKKHHRAYSISSTPDQSETLAFTVKRVPCGLVSNHLIDHFRAGDHLEALAPTGEFHLPSQIFGKQVMLSAGSGITPMMSMARWLLTHRPEIDIHFIYSARTEQDVIFCDELLAMVERHPNFRLDIFLSQPKGTVWCHTGRLTPERLTALLSEATKCNIYLCGHQEYMDMVEEWHATQGLPAERFYKESFSPAALPQTAPGSDVYSLSVPSFGKTAAILDGQPLLEVLEAEGLPIIAACRSGICGSCKCKVIEGEVERISTETLTQDEVDAGVVLACSTHARSSLIVDLAF